MAKTKTEQRLIKALRARGLRKNVAETLAQASSRARSGTKATKPVRRLITELRDITGEVEDRLTGGGSAKRKAAAKKAARTRKLNAAKRSASAKKGAVTRAKKKPAKRKAAKR